MRSLLQVLCVLSTLAATGYSLSCTQCMALSGTSCTGPSITCPADKVCLSSYTVTTAGGMVISNVFGRDCELQSKCGTSGSISVPNAKIKMSTSCCTTDNCTPPIPTLPADNDVMNGLTCRTCTSADSDWCYTSDTMKCTGNEKMCLLQTTKMSGTRAGIVAVRGCASESICNIGTQTGSYGDVEMKVTFSCTNGSNRLHPGFFLPAVVALMLIKLLS
ncbi:phospholipase A2 inhibitor NAI-like [Ascaphus truei]|uniref:phospholipase A2 inhibitor NAI-like n=1 Tax=Ascaphus truei TaxID=8439 RepID=UPI003F5A3734